MASEVGGLESLRAGELEGGGAGLVGVCFFLSVVRYWRGWARLCVYFFFFLLLLVHIVVHTGRLCGAG